MPKVWCAEILCEHNKNNQCKANEINLSAGNIHTVNEGFRQIWTCRAFAMRDDAKKLKVLIEEFYKSRGGTVMESKYCPWCMNKNRKTELDFSVIDDMSGQYMHPNMIKYCVVCGRELYNERKKQDGMDKRERWAAGR